MKRLRILAVFLAAVLCVVLGAILRGRSNETETVLFGGAAGGRVRVQDKDEFRDPVEVNREPDDGIDWPDITLSELQDNRQYAIVNDKHLLSSAFEPEAGRISGSTQLFDVNALPYLENMLQDLRDHGYHPYLAGAYRTYSYQEKLFNGKASQIALGLDPPVTDYNDPRYQEAVQQARRITAYPGSSEHQLGLAVDILDRERSWLDYSKMDQDFFAYLDSICASYGFIKRYPADKLPLTGWEEPYHYRYVGVEVATFIMEHGICYEEFYAHYDKDFEY
ncbi:MAG: M15 family metallopeptidase [Oscillospiraceae bacterium]|nr:M15 family metallopeptidase [Oscillospiraceae bacterium]